MSYDADGRYVAEAKLPKAAQEKLDHAKAFAEAAKKRAAEKADDKRTDR